MTDPQKLRDMKDAPTNGVAILAFDHYETDGHCYADGRRHQTGRDGFGWVVARFTEQHRWHVAASVVGGNYIPLRNPIKWLPLLEAPSHD